MLIHQTDDHTRGTNTIINGTNTGSNTEMANLANNEGSREEGEGERNRETLTRTIDGGELGTMKEDKGEKERGEEERERCVHGADQRH